MIPLETEPDIAWEVAELWKPLNYGSERRKEANAESLRATNFDDDGLHF